MSYEGTTSYDVADMLKQYFRDLPEPVVTTKLSDTFISIFTCEYEPFISPSAQCANKIKDWRPVC